jgi:MFS family permease
MSQQVSAAPLAEAGASTLAPRLTAAQYRVLGVGALGGALEYYEYVIFIFLTPVISTLMFPADIPQWLKLLQTFAIFAAGNLAKPLGGILLGVLGDRIGRKRSFGVTLLMMALPTLCIGLLPTYAQVGVVAPLLLLACRIFQGIALGGEFPTAMTFIVEHVPERRSGFSIGVTSSAFTCGMLLAILMLIVVGNGYPGAKMLSFGWRVPFLIGGVFGLAAAFSRRYVQETPVFHAMQQRKQTTKRVPFSDLLKHYPKEVLLCVLASLSQSGTIGALMIFPLSYLQVELGMSRDVVNQAQLWMLGSIIVGNVLVGALTDRFGLRYVVPLFAAGTIAACYATFASPDAATLRYGFAAVGLGLTFATGMNIILVRSFPASVRLTGFATAYNPTSALVGGLLPLVMSYLAHLDSATLVYVPALFAICGMVVAPLSVRYIKPLYETA